MSEKWNMIVDVALCSNCHNCSLAVKDEYIGNEFPGYSAPQPKHGHEWIKLTRRVRGTGHLVDVAYLPTMCNHCDNAPCVAAGGGCVTKRADGIVLIDPEKSVGRKDLVDTCPYGAIWWNEELQIPQHWTFDAHLLDAGWTEPRASQACPTGALEAVKISDTQMAKRVKDDALEVVKTDEDLGSRVFYKNLHRFSKHFVGGSVVANVNGQTECVENAEVTLSRGKKNVATVRTDIFGDFKFDALDSETGSYDIAAIHESFGKAAKKVKVKGSIVLPPLKLT